VHRVVTGLSPYLSLEDILRSDERSICSVDSEQRSALFYAGETGDAEMVKLLIRHGADVNRPDAWGSSPLMAATWAGQTGCVEVLLNAGADVHCRNFWGENAIFFSCQAGQTECARLLLQYGADVQMDPVPYNLCSLLHTVAYYGFVDMVDILIDYGADIEQRDGNGLTAIELALWWGFGKTGTKLDKVARRFCERGASLSSLDGFKCRNYGNEACFVRS
jgi:ankyrin repeat protein